MTNGMEAPCSDGKPRALKALGHGDPEPEACVFLRTRNLFASQPQWLIDTPLSPLSSHPRSLLLLLPPPRLLLQLLAITAGPLAQQQHPQPHDRVSDSQFLDGFDCDKFVGLGD